MNKVYDTLYCQDNKGNVRIWFMEQSNDKYRTISGIIDGEKVTSEWRTAEPKNIGKSNETSGKEQATAEIEAKYKKQLKTGYNKSLDEAGEIRYVEPMLAYSINKINKKPDFLNDRWGIQCKFNGNRCIATKEGLFTRKGEKYLCVPHIELALKPFFKDHPNAVLDGELFNNDLRQKLNEISKLIKKNKHIEPEDLIKSEKFVKFYIYDGYGFSKGSICLDEGVAYEERKIWIDEFLIPTSEYFCLVPTEIVKNEGHMKGLFCEFISDHQEGAILRKMNSSYEHKRSKNLIKVKSEDSDEAVVLDIIDGDGNWAGAATNVTLRWKDKIFDAVFKGDYETREEILRNKKDWIGKEVTFLYFGLTGLGVPNYARVDPNNCFSVDK